MASGFKSGGSCTNRAFLAGSCSLLDPVDRLDAAAADREAARLTAFSLGGRLPLMKSETRGGLTPISAAKVARDVDERMSEVSIRRGTSGSFRSATASLPAVDAARRLGKFLPTAAAARDERG